MTKNTRFSPEVRQRAIRMVIESQNDYGSQWAAISSIAPKIGCTPETLRTWLRQYKRGREYNHERTHSSLNDMTPAEFIRSLRKDEAL
ncbi:transposase [Salmonella enterica]|uniref:transposase n=1 Tax=Salmonella enterica TaxID=28901 RepID=UPI00221FF477|nr:transposase [Salmonella enterica]